MIDFDEGPKDVWKSWQTTLEVRRSRFAYPGLYYIYEPKMKKYLSRDLTLETSFGWSTYETAAAWQEAMFFHTLEDAMGVVNIWWENLDG